MVDILRNALETICDLANTHLENLDRRGDAWVVLTSLVDHDGAINVAARDKIVMTVFNIERETIISSFPPNASAPFSQDNATAVVNPPIYIDIHVMFMANFPEKSYVDGLAALSRVISFFQQNPYFNVNNAPNLDPSIGKLTLDLESMTPVDVNYVMSMLGTRYLPCVFYKLRMLVYASSAMQLRAYAVTSGGVARPDAAA